MLKVSYLFDYKSRLIIIFTKKNYLNYNAIFTIKNKPYFSTRRALLSIQKDCVPTNQKSSAIYEFTCQCDSGYEGRTTQRLGDMIKQHVPSNIRNKTAPQREQPLRSCRSRNTVKTSDSAIGQHLLDNPDCAISIMTTCFG